MNRHWILVVTALAFAAVFILSPRGWSMVNQPGFDKIAELSPASQRPMRVWLDERGVTMPWPGLPEAQQPLLTLGYAYREVGALRMPFAAYGDPGLVLYDARGKWGPAVPLDAAGQAQLRGIAGRALGDGYHFPLWRFLWGWLFVVPLAAWYRLQLREERRRSDEAGII